MFIGHNSNRHCLCLIKDNVLLMVHFAPIDKRLAQNGVETAEMDIRQLSNQHAATRLMCGLFQPALGDCHEVIGVPFLIPLGVYIYTIASSCKFINVFSSSQCFLFRLQLIDPCRKKTLNWQTDPSPGPLCTSISTIECWPIFSNPPIVPFLLYLLAPARR